MIELFLLIELMTRVVAAVVAMMLLMVAALSSQAGQTLWFMAMSLILVMVFVVGESACA